MFSGDIERERALAWKVLIFSYNTNTMQNENDLTVNKVVNEYPYFFNPRRVCVAVWSKIAN